MGSYYQVLPVNGGLFVPAANMSKLIADINEYFEDNSMDQTIRIMQRVPVDGSSEAYPAVTLKTNDFKEVQDFYNEYAKEVGSVSRGGVHVSSEDYSNSVSMKELRDIAGNWVNFQDYLRP